MQARLNLSVCYKIIWERGSLPGIPSGHRPSNTGHAKPVGAGRKWAWVLENNTRHAASTSFPSHLLTSTADLHSGSSA